MGLWLWFVCLDVFALCCCLFLVLFAWFVGLLFDVIYVLVACLGVC